MGFEPILTLLGSMAYKAMAFTVKLYPKIKQRPLRNNSSRPPLLVTPSIYKRPIRTTEKKKAKLSASFYINAITIIKKERGTFIVITKLRSSDLNREFQDMNLACFRCTTAHNSEWDSRNPVFGMKTQRLNRLTNPPFKNKTRNKS